MSARITGLFIYPVKSCRGLAMPNLVFDANGPVNDRRWMIVDENNQFMTLRTFSKLAEIQTSVQGPFLHLYAGSNKILVNTTEECEQVEDVTIWGETFKAGIENKSINEALSDFLTKTVKLVRYQSQSFRDLGTAGTEAVKQTMFSDARPLLMTNTASLEELNGRLQSQGQAPSQMERFRSNMVIEGLPAFAEDDVVRVTIKNSKGDVVLANPKLCGRCPIIT
ncbi:MAG: MOSC N-terminal beta barrel domain-containing protein, partial [Bdellovibrionaceae bacterium]|nr:MOSC N-terminal beta barrel domain-containing protein [Pseudobdellovibrionaceae bacterium]